MHRTCEHLTILCVVICVSALRAASLEIELDRVSPGGELVAGAGARLRIDGWVVLAGANDRVDGWTLSVAGRGAGLYFVERVTELCDARCVAELTGFEVASHTAGVVDPSAHGEQGQGVVDARVGVDQHRDGHGSRRARVGRLAAGGAPLRVR